MTKLMHGYWYINFSLQVCIGGEVPKSYYRSIDQCVDPSRLKRVTVAAGCSEDVSVTVTEPNSVLRLETIQSVDKFYYVNTFLDSKYGIR